MATEDAQAGDAGFEAGTFDGGSEGGSEGDGGPVDAGEAGPLDGGPGDGSSPADAEVEASADGGSDAGDGAPSLPCQDVDCSHLDTECGTGVCDPASGKCKRELAPVDTPCGNAAADACDAQDTCDGTGTCVEAFASAGTVCGSSDDACLLDPVCDGRGTCQPGEPAPSGTVCADPTQPCMLGGECNGGVCTPQGPAPAGTPCGDPSVSDCDDADRCDGAGTCEPNHASDGLACGDCPGGGTCKGCQSGICETDGCTKLAPDVLGTKVCIAAAADLPCPDIRATGNVTDLGDDEQSQLLVLGFDFAFYSKPANTFLLHADGVVGVAADGSLPPEDTGLIDYDGELPLLAPYWDDLVGAPDAGGHVYWQLQNGADGQQLVLQWASTRKGAGDVDVRAVLHGGSDVIELCYVDTDVGDPALDSGATASVGTAAQGGDPVYVFSANQPLVPSGTYVRLEPTALLFEGFEALDTLRDAPGWEFPFSDAAMAVDFEDAASGVRSLNHSGVGELGTATYRFDRVLDSGLVRVEADVLHDADGVVPVVQLGLVVAGTGQALHRRRVAWTLEADHFWLVNRSGAGNTTDVDQAPSDGVWEHMVLEVDFDANVVRGYYGGELLVERPLGYDAFDTLLLLLGPNEGVMRVDNVLVTHEP